MGGTSRTLVLPSPRDALGSQTALAHIVYEMARTLDANIGLTNEELLNRVTWVLGLLGTNPVILHPEAQLGLAGDVSYSGNFSKSRALGVTAPPLLSIVGLMAPGTSQPMG